MWVCTVQSEWAGVNRNNAAIVLQTNLLTVRTCTGLAFLTFVVPVEFGANWACRLKCDSMWREVRIIIYFMKHN